MDTGPVYAALRDSQVEVGLVFATDGRIPAFDFVVLATTRASFRAIRSRRWCARRRSTRTKLAEILNGLSAKLDDATMASLNATVDVDKKTIEDDSSTFLKSQVLI